MRKQDVIRWGILGPGWIASKFVSDLQHVSDAQAVAVGSRTKENAEQFAQRFGIAKAYGSYEELVQDPDVDIIYVATPHPAHYEHAKLCLDAGKAVLCEKPFTVQAAHTEQLIQIAREKKLFLMEAMWTRYLPAIRQAMAWIKDGRIGEVRMMRADFGFRTEWNPEGRLLNPDLAGGALLDVGIYPISFASMVFGGPPERVMSSAHLGDTGVDEQFAVVFSYGGGRTASLGGAVRVQLDNECHIYGTEGKIYIPDFFMAKSAVLQIAGQEPERFASADAGTGYQYEAEEAGRCMREGLLESPLMPLDETLQIMKTLDEIRGQWGLRYPFE